MNTQRIEACFNENARHNIEFTVGANHANASVLL